MLEYARDEGHYELTTNGYCLGSRFMEVPLALKDYSSVRMSMQRLHWGLSSEDRPSMDW